MPNSAIAPAPRVHFDAAEKVLDIHFLPGSLRLRALPKNFWQEILAKTGIRILSSIHGNFFDAYLLSESTLLVAEDHIHLITCGRGPLLPTAHALFEKTGTAAVTRITYENLSGVQPHTQAQPISDDIMGLKALFPDHLNTVPSQINPEIFIYQAARQATQSTNSIGLRLLMTDLHPDACRFFQQDGIREQCIRQKLSFETFFPDFKIDDHVFSPPGYSANGIFENCYYTIHVTPQASGSYASFETNECWPMAQRAIQQMLDFFAPRRFDLLTSEERTRQNFTQHKSRESSFEPRISRLRP